MAVEWEQFLKEVLPDVKGCPVTIAENAIRNAVIDFCNQSRVWREDAAPISLVQGTSAYTIDVSAVDPAGEAQIVTVHKVRLTDSNIPLPALPLQYADDFITQTAEQRPEWFYCKSPPQIVFGPAAPDAAYTTAELKVVLKPTRDATQAPDFIYNDWLEEIAHGAKYRLMAMEGRPWAAVDMVSYHRREFVTGWTEARIRDVKGNVQSTTMAVPRQKFGRYHNSRYFR